MADDDFDAEELADRAARLKYARERLSDYTSAAGAARAMGVQEPTYSAHENGSRGFRVDMAYKYARFYKIDLQWLLFGFGNPRGPSIGDKVACLSKERRRVIEEQIEWQLQKQAEERQSGKKS
jgi:transcriptional regulator with XRE-family HTH domain